MVLEDFEPIFGEPKVDWADRGSLPLRRFVYYVHSPDPSHIGVHISDFHANTWEAILSVHQLEDMRDDVGMGGSWSEFIDYFLSSLKSEDVRLVLEGLSGSGAAYAKLAAQKFKGMPLIFIPLVKLEGPDAAETIGNLSFQLLTALKATQLSLRQVKNQSLQLAEHAPNEKDGNASIQNEQERCLKKQKLPYVNAASASSISKPSMSKTRDSPSRKTATHVIPAHRRARVRGAVLQLSKDDTSE
ncbi:hypothetical protein SAY87_020294 [Trapa incisa]|uniref:Uncharacterized protein n=1 Tax=Trapa incisa TaxID=236973 RepID=A0AAN7K759_9MYRT|nr:hypothetical protein SAY87_020294 [Trapa incisa]